MWSTQEITDSNSVWTVQSQSNFDNDGARPVPYLQLVSLVKCLLEVDSMILSFQNYCYPQGSQRRP